MDLRHARTFVTVAELGTVSSATAIGWRRWAWPIGAGSCASPWRFPGISDVLFLASRPTIAECWPLTCARFSR